MRALSAILVGSKRWLLAAALAVLGTAPGCAVAEKPLEFPYRAVVTTAMVKDIVEQVAGERAQVIALMGEGVDPHLYKPTRDDVQKLLSAHVIFYSGLMLEGRMGETFNRVSKRGIPVFAVTELIDRRSLLASEDGSGHTDPHVWMDVAAWSQAVEAAARALSRFDPAHTAYGENAARYRSVLAELDDYARRTIASIPREQRVLITAHDAFGYFGRAYGIEVVGIQGISTESEAGVQDINRLVDRIVQQRIPAIFVETSVSDKNVRAIIEGAARRGWTVRIGGTLFSDAMGAPGTYEGTYVGMIDHNVTVIARALGGTAPERGLRGNLSAVR